MAHKKPAKVVDLLVARGGHATVPSVKKHLPPPGEESYGAYEGGSADVLNGREGQVSFKPKKRKTGLSTYANQV